MSGDDRIVMRHDDPGDRAVRINPRTVVIDGAIEEIEQELGRRLDAVERPAIVAVLERFAEQWPRPQQRYPWC